MDKRKNKILIGCLALLLVMTVGYALFSENITINGTATAKGDFNVTPTCIEGTVAPGNYGFVEGGYKNVVCTVDDSNDAVTISAEFEYPGAVRIFSIKMTNTGTIDAIAPYALELNPEWKFCYSDDIDADPKNGTCTTGRSGDSIAYAIQVGNGTVYNTVEDFGANINDIPSSVMEQFFDGNNNVILKPGNSIYYIALLGVTEDLGTDHGGVMNIIYTTPYKGTFTQITN